MPIDETDPYTTDRMHDRVQAYYDTVVDGSALPPLEDDELFNLITDLSATLGIYAHALGELAEGYLRERENPGSSFAGRAYRHATKLVEVDESGYWGRPPNLHVLDRDLIDRIGAQWRERKRWIRDRKRWTHLPWTKLRDGFNQLNLGALPRRGRRRDKE